MRYRAPVAQSWQLAHLTPRALPWQRVLAHQLRIEPRPTSAATSSTASATRSPISACMPRTASLRVLHALRGRGRRAPIGRRGRARPPGSRCAMRCAARAGAGRSAAGADVRADPRWCRCPSRRGLCRRRRSRAGATGSRRSTDLMHRIHADFEFDPGATTVSTAVDEVLEQRSGVCQDFAHLMLGCLRGHGLPARYVSGYLLTDPPPGRPRLLGADASHAWVAAYAPRHGWVEFDPTNDRVADRRYITLAWGARLRRRGAAARRHPRRARPDAWTVEVSVIPAPDRGAPSRGVGHRGLQVPAAGWPDAAAPADCRHRSPHPGDAHDPPDARFHRDPAAAERTAVGARRRADSAPPSPADPAGSIPAGTCNRGCEVREGSRTRPACANGSTGCLRVRASHRRWLPERRRRGASPPVASSPQRPPQRARAPPPRPARSPPARSSSTSCSA